jgi:hypothetical protein
MYSLPMSRLRRSYPEDRRPALVKIKLRKENRNWIGRCYVFWFYNDIWNKNLSNENISDKNISKNQLTKIYQAKIYQKYIEIYRKRT